MRVEISTGMLKWARSRAGLGLSSLLKRLPKVDLWEKGELSPTLKQLEHFAKITHTPLGYLFLKAPPEENVPIPDFRKITREHEGRPSPDLLDTIYICQQRQEWYHDFVRANNEDPLPFVGSVTTEADIEKTAAEIRHALKLDIEERRRLPTWREALRLFIQQTDELGILTMCSGVVKNNTHRHLNPDEFRGFAIADTYAPLIFINGADTKAAQIFTLAHEIAHIWLGQSAVSDVEAAWIPDNDIERWCNKVAAELLVPLGILRDDFQEQNDLGVEMNRLARFFKVSTLVILRRLYDAGKLTQEKFTSEYQKELRRLRQIKKGTGGDFYLTQSARVSKRFARALVISTLEGQTLHRDAFNLLGFSKLETFHKLGKSLGVIL